MGTRVHVRRWLRGIVSRHSPVRPSPYVDDHGEPLLISAAWDEASTREKAGSSDLPLDSIETLSQPWARQSIEGWYRAHNEPGDDAPRDGALPMMDEERFLTFGKQATSLSELELLDLLDLFDRESVGEIGFEYFVVVMGFLLAVETGTFAPFITQHVAALHEMLTRPCSSGPTPTAVIQLGTLAGLGDRAVEQSLAQLQMSIAEPIASHGDFGRLLFATLGAANPRAEAAAWEDTKSSPGFDRYEDIDGTTMGRANRRRAVGRGLRGMCGACSCGQRTRGVDYAA